MNPAALSAALRGDIDNFIAASTPGGIERQEAAGQQTLLKSDMIPKKVSGATRDELTALGFKFGEDVDDLFVSCELPTGWTKRGTEHTMHSDILDERGHRRAWIFYKAAFYDRRANMGMDRRYSFDTLLPGSSDGTYRTGVLDKGHVIKEFGEVDRVDYAGMDALEKAAKAWLNEQYPDWRNPLAYW